MKKRSVILFVMVFTMLFLTRCAAKRIILKPTFWQQKESKIGVAVVKYPIAGAHRRGGQGLLDMAINEALAGNLKDYLRQVDMTVFSNIIDKFVQNLGEKGITAKRIDELIDLEQLQVFKSSQSGNYTKVDFKPLSQEKNINMLILLSIQSFGTIRPYYGFIPLGSPKAFCLAKGQLINLDNNAILWLYTMKELEASIPVEGKWNQPPDYPNLTKAIEKAIENAKTSLEKDFFKF